MSTHDIGVKIKLDGEKEYRKQIQNITAQQKLLKAQLENSTASFTKNTSAVQKNAAMSKNLTEQVKVQQSRVDELRGMVEKASAAYQEGDTQLLKWQQQLESAEAELKSMQAELKAIPNTLQSVGADLKAFGGKLQNVGDKITGVGNTLTKTVTVPIVGAFTAATKASLSFEDGMAKVYTIADQSVKPMSQMSEEILALSNRTGKGAGELAEAAYQALSASVDTKDAVNFVATATDLAKAGFLETAGAVDVLTTIINAYGYSAADAQKIADQLVQTQNDGKTTVDQLAQSMGQVIPTAAALNIPLEQLDAAYAIMTKQGINTANTTTYLNGLFTELADGGSDVAAVLQEKTGKTFGQLMSSGATLADVLSVLADSVKGDETAMKNLLGVSADAIDETDNASEKFLNLWGNVRAGRGALSITNGGIEEFNQEVGKMQGATGNVASALEVLDTNGAKARKAMTQLVNAGIQIGDRLAPYVGKAAEKVSELLAKWDALSPEMKDSIVKAAAIAAAVGPVVTIVGKLVSGAGLLTVGLGTILPAAGAILPVIGAALPVLAGVTAAVAGIILVVKNWGTITEWFKGVWTSVTTAVTTAVDTAKTDLSNDWNTIKTGFSTMIDGAKAKIDAAKAWLSAIPDTVHSAVDRVLGFFDQLRDGVRSRLDTARQFIADSLARIRSLFNVEWSLPHIKMPHFSWSWQSVGGLISLPRIHVDWYKKAYDDPVMFTRPTVLATPSGFKGFGDGNGGEITIGRNTMFAMIRDAVSAGETNNYSGDINVVVNAAPGQDVRELADLVADRINTQVLRRRAAFA